MGNLVSEIKEQMARAPGPRRGGVSIQAAPSERNENMASRYREGATLQEIGAENGISRERVRQILRRVGITSREGGSSKKARDRAAKEKARKEERFWRKYGMTKKRYYEVNKRLDANGAKPIDRYASQRKNAIERGIPWHFDFATWWGIWERSGKWEQRGRNNGYVMSRPNDIGPYAPNNVQIVRSGENNREYINRFWGEVRQGLRPAPDQTRSKRNKRSKYGFHRLVVGDYLTIRTPDVRAVQKHAFSYAQGKGWKIKTKSQGDKLTVTRVS